MQVTSRCYAVTGLAYRPPWSVNAGFIVGDEVTLVVDTGANALAGATIHGYAKAARPGNLIRAINTEPHFDHIGGNSYFRGQGCEIYGHRDIERTPEEFAEEMRGFREAIPPGARRWRQEERVFYRDTSVENPNQAIFDDAMYDLGNCPVEVLLTPGHTQMNLSVWVPGEGVLYSGDLLANGYLPNLDAAAGDASWRQWLVSLDRVERLRPRVIVPGHGAVAQGEDTAPLIGEARRVVRKAIERGVSETAGFRAESDVGASQASTAPRPQVMATPVSPPPLPTYKMQTPPAGAETRAEAGGTLPPDSFANGLYADTRYEDTPYGDTPGGAMEAAFPAPAPPPPSAGSLWRDAVLDLCASFAVILGVTVVGGVGIAVAGMLRGGEFTGIGPVANVSREPAMAWLIVVVLLVTQLSLLFFARRRLRRNREKGRPPVVLLQGDWGKPAALGAACGIGLQGVAIAYSALLQQFMDEPLITDQAEVFLQLADNTPALSALVIIVAVMAPVCEELFFRAAIFGSARSVSQVRTGLTISCVLFAIVHFSLPLAPFYILFAAVSCWLFARTGSMAAPVAAHMALNSVASVAMISMAGGTV